MRSKRCQKLGRSVTFLNFKSHSSSILILAISQIFASTQLKKTSISRMWTTFLGFKFSSTLDRDSLVGWNLLFMSIYKKKAIYGSCLLHSLSTNFTRSIWLFHMLRATVNMFIENIWLNMKHNVILSTSLGFVVKLWLLIWMIYYNQMISLKINENLKVWALVRNNGEHKIEDLSDLGEREVYQIMN